MSIGIILAAAALAPASGGPAAAAPAEPAAAYGPTTPPPSRTAASAPARKACSPQAPDPNSDTIVVCVVKPEGYRIDPDVLSAKKAKRQADQGRPRSPERYADNSCASVGPHGCIGTGVNLLGAALTAAQIAGRLAKGQDVGSVFRTDPQMSEYQYYQLAKAEREKRKAEQNGDGYLAQVEAEEAAKSQAKK